MKAFLVFFLVVFSCYNLTAQDSLSVEQNETVTEPHSARKATLLSTAAPGAGQIYNKKAWKAPIVWVGMGTCIYFISDNRKRFRSFKSDLILRQNDPTYLSPLTYRDLGTYSNGLDNLVSDADLREAVDQRKSWLDLSYFSLLAVYGLNIIDANIDGHLFDHDITPDLSLRINPSSYWNEGPKAGLSFTLNF